VNAEWKRGAQPCVAQLASSSSRWRRPRHPGRDLPDESLCLGAHGAADADDKGEKPQTGCAWLVGWHGILGYLPGRVGNNKQVHPACY
jgi:hypothetical protein